MPKYVKRLDRRREWRWVLYADNGEPIGVCSEGHPHEATCNNSIRLARGLNPYPVLKELLGALGVAEVPDPHFHPPRVKPAVGLQVPNALAMTRPRLGIR